MTKTITKEGPSPEIGTPDQRPETTMLKVQKGMLLTSSQLCCYSKQLLLPNVCFLYTVLYGGVSLEGVLIALVKLTNYNGCKYLIHSVLYFNPL